MLSPDLVCSHSPFPFCLTLVPSSIYNNSHMFMPKYWTFFYYWQLRKATVSASLQEQSFLKRTVLCLYSLKLLGCQKTVSVVELHYLKQGCEECRDHFHTHFFPPVATESKNEACSLPQKCSLDLIQ